MDRILLLQKSFKKLRSFVEFMTKRIITKLRQIYRLGMGGVEKPCRDRGCEMDQSEPFIFYPPRQFGIE